MPALPVSAPGDANFELKRCEEAERLCQSALKENPNDVTARKLT